MEKKLATAYSELKNACMEKGIKIIKDFDITPINDETFISVSEISVEKHLTTGELDILWEIWFDKKIGKSVFDNMGEYNYIDYSDDSILGAIAKDDSPSKNLENVVNCIKDITQAIRKI